MDPVRLLAQLDDYGVWVAAVVGGLGAVGWLLRRIVRAWRRAWRACSDFVDDVRAMVALTDHQLNNNGGGSLLDKIDRIDQRVDRIDGRVDDALTGLDDLSERFDDHLKTLAEANRALWPAVEQIAKSTPHTEATGT